MYICKVKNGWGEKNKDEINKKLSMDENNYLNKKLSMDENNYLNKLFK